MPAKEITLQPSNIENIDTALYEWVDKLDLSVFSNEGYKKVPAIWLGTERAYQIKSDKELRDSVGKLKLPLITVNRESVSKDPSYKGSFQAHYGEVGDHKGGFVKIRRKVQQEKTRNYANSDFSKENNNANRTGKAPVKKVVFEEITIPNPTYVTIMYTIVVRSEYQQHMNDLVVPFITRTGNINSFLLKRNGWSYEAFIQPDFTENKNVENLGEEERMFETKIQIKVLGILVGEGPNRQKPKITIRETRTVVTISRERVITGDKKPWKTKEKDYREF